MVGKVRYTGRWSSEPDREYELDPEERPLDARAGSDLERWAEEVRSGGGCLPPAKGRKVLIVEDDLPLARLLSEVLHRDGHRTMVAGSGVEGLDLLRVFRPGVVVLDVMMPDMHGYEVCRAIREDPSMEGVRILLSTAKPYPPEAVEVFGADGMLRKPYGADALRRSVGRLFEPASED